MAACMCVCMLPALLTIANRVCLCFLTGQVHPSDDRTAVLHPYLAHCGQWCVEREQRPRTAAGQGSHGCHCYRLPCLQHNVFRSSHVKGTFVVFHKNIGPTFPDFP